MRRTRQCASITVELNHGWVVWGIGPWIRRDSTPSPRRKAVYERPAVSGSDPILGAGLYFCLISASFLPHPAILRCFQWKECPGKIEVGTPVAGRPPHRSRRAVYQHRALGDISLTHVTGSGGSAETAYGALRQRHRPLIPVESAQGPSPRSRGEVSGSGAGAAQTRGPYNSSSDCAD